MRVIMIAIGSAGDVFPFIGLGAALTLRGHQVTLCSMPAFQRTIEARGLTSCRYAMRRPTTLPWAIPACGIRRLPSACCGKPSQAY